MGAHTFPNHTEKRGPAGQHVSLLQKPTPWCSLKPLFAIRQYALNLTRLQKYIGNTTMITVTMTMRVNLCRYLWWETVFCSSSHWHIALKEEASDLGLWNLECSELENTTDIKRTLNFYRVLYRGLGWKQGELISAEKCFIDDLKAQYWPRVKTQQCIKKMLLMKVVSNLNYYMTEWYLSSLI